MTTITDKRFEDLFSELMSKCNLSREKLSQLIKEKREKVGGGYLTDQGALFLVASELGIVVDYDHKKPANLSQLSKDQSSVTVLARILSVGFPKSFERKGGPQKGILCRIVIYDNNATVSVSLWDASVASFLEKDIRPGDLVTITNASVRASIDGSIFLNFIEKSEIQKIPTETAKNSIQKLEEKIQPLRSIPESGRSMVVQGKVTGEARKTSFTRNDGSQSYLTSFTISDLENEDSKYRVAVWGNPNPVFAELKDSEVITLLGVRPRISNFQNTLAVEIHGDETTCILEHWESTKNWMKELAKQLEPAKVQGALPFVARVLAMHQLSDGRVHILLADSQKRKIMASLSGDALNDLSNVNVDDVIVVKPDSFEAAALKAIASKKGSITRSAAKRPDIEASSSLLRTVENLQNAGVASLELMCLTDSLSREIQTKEGLVRRTEVTVADHTGEIKLYGWRNLSKLLEDYSAGDRIMAEAVEVQMHEGKKFLQLKNYSSVELKKG